MNDTNWLVVIGVVVAGAALFLLAGSHPASVPVAPPSVNAGPDIVVPECTSVQLTCDATDPNGDHLTYNWTADKGSFNDSHILHPVYTAPAVCGSGEDITITLTATNEHGLSSSDTLIAHVCNVPSPSAPIYCPPAPPHPVVTHTCPPPPPAPRCPSQVVQQCKPANSAKSINEGQSIQLHGKICDPDNNVVSYRWAATAGTFNDPTSLNPVYTAPMVTTCAGEDVCITLTAVDSCCAKGVDQIILHINNVNHLPIVNAGNDLTLAPCGSVKLTCSASDPDGDPLTYRWTITSGGGSFVNPYVLHPVYIAPPLECGQPEDVVLTLTATDSCGASTSDVVVIHVQRCATP